MSLLIYMDQNNSNQDQSQQITPPPSDNAGDAVNTQDATQNQTVADTQDNTTSQDQQLDASAAAEPQSGPTDTAAQQTTDQIQPAQQTDQTSQNQTPQN